MDLARTFTKVNRIAFNVFDQFKHSLEFRLMTLLIPCSNFPTTETV